MSFRYQPRSILAPRNSAGNAKSDVDSMQTRYRDLFTLGLAMVSGLLMICTA
jgi:hypothetical protein